MTGKKILRKEENLFPQYHQWISYFSLNIYSEVFDITQKLWIHMGHSTDSRVTQISSFL